MTCTLLAAQTQDQRPIIRRQANFIRVDVYPTKDGRAVDDLQAAEFEVLEDNVPQEIETFEAVRIEGGVEGREPTSVRDANRMAADPRPGVFVLFLDVYFVTDVNSARLSATLARSLEPLLGENDLVGVMTPAMDVRDLTLGRKTDIMQRGLLTNTRWGRSINVPNPLFMLDEQETAYTICYPPERLEPISVTARELITRRRERFTLDSLVDIARHLGAIREERKAVIVVSEGWPLRRANDVLGGRARGMDGPQVRIGPGGRLGTSDPRNRVDTAACDRDLRTASGYDNHYHHRQLLDEANRYNTSFYTLDAKGLDPYARASDSLAELALNTDGLAIENTNDFRTGLQRIAADLSFYYLLGYQSSNSKADGAFRSIKVRVKRPGVSVRARKGYRGLTREEMKTMTEAPPAPPPGTLVDDAVASALGRLSRQQRTAVVQLHAVADAPRKEIWIAGELDGAALSSPEWAKGAQAAILVDGPGGASGSGKATIAERGRSFLARLPLSSAGPGEYNITARVTPAGASAVGESITLTIADAPLGPSLAFRRVAAQPFEPVATFRWRRNESLRLQAALGAAASPGAGRLLDRTGAPLEVPVTVTLREGPGERWLVADVALAPLTAGDYLIELTATAADKPARTLTAIRVIR